MIAPLADAALDQLFRNARSHNGWATDPIPESTLRQIYELARMGPTAANSSPARFVFVTSPEAKERLASVSSGSNQPKIKDAPATVIVGYDLDFPERLPTLFPHALAMKAVFADPALAEQTAFRNSTLQGAYLIMAARSLGFDCGPMSGFDNGKVDALFFAGTRIRSNFICSIGRGNGENMFRRLPRLSFEDACKIV
jgi:3-hydroxypropanoate dehydrogenase